MLKRHLLFTFVFIFVIFAFATPFDLSKASRDFSGAGASLEEFISAINAGSLQRRVALASLALFGILCLLRRLPVRGKVNGILGWLILTYFSLTILSVTWADDPLLTWRRVMILIMLTLGALGIARIFTLEDIIHLALFVTSATLITSVIAEISFGTFSLYSDSWRFAGVLHPIDQGWNCGIMAISSFAKFKSVRRKKIVYFGIIVVALIFLVLTKSRMPFAATIFAILVYWSLLSSRLNKAAILIPVCILSILSYFFLEDYFKVLDGLLRTFGRGEEGEATLGTLTGRLTLWKECLRMVSFRPLLGYGYNSYLSPNHLKTITSAIGFTPSSPHSGYIDALFSLGVAGFATLTLMLAFAIKESIKLIHASYRNTVLLAILVWLCANLVFETNLVTGPIFPHFYVLILLMKLGFYKSTLHPDSISFTSRPLPFMVRRRKQLGDYGGKHLN
jgi:exopolysaccharide production protein ExoQ